MLRYLVPHLVSITVYNHLLIDQLIQAHQANVGDSFQEVAKQMGLSRSYLYDLKEGRSSPTLRSLQTVADYFAIPLALLLLPPVSDEAVHLAVRLLRHLPAASPEQHKQVLDELQRLVRQLES